MNIDLIVTRHKGLVEYLEKKGISAPVISHVENPDSLNGKIVAGVLPLNIAARCAEVIEVELEIPSNLRGKELDYETMLPLVRGISSYKVIKTPIEI